MKIFKDVAIATGKTLWHVACEIGTGIDDYGQAKYGNLFLAQDDNIITPSSPKLVADMRAFDSDSDSEFNLNEPSESGPFSFTEYLLNPLIGLTIQYGGFDLNDIPIIQEDISYYG